MSETPQAVESKRCNPWCAPLIIYLTLTTLSVVGNLLTSSAPLADRLSNAKRATIWSGLISVLLYVLCRFCKSGWAWAIVALPIILAGIGITFLLLAGGLTPKTTVQPMPPQ